MTEPTHDPYSVAAPDDLAFAIADEVEALHAARPTVPLLEIFDEVMKDHHRTVVRFGALFDQYGGSQFVGLLIDAFYPEGKLAAATSESGQEEEFLGVIAASRFQQRYGLNGREGRERWSGLFADEMLRLGVATERTLAVERGLALWDEGHWRENPTKLADQMARVDEQAAAALAHAAKRCS